MSDEVPDGLVQKGGSPIFTEDSLPSALLEEHSLAEGRWGLLHLLEGNVIFVQLSPVKETALTAPATLLIEPTAPHKLRLTGPLKLRIDFYRRAD